MKLHLPKGLLTAVLAFAGIAGSAAFALEIGQWTALDLSSEGSATASTGATVSWGAAADNGLVTIQNIPGYLFKFDVTPDWVLTDRQDLVYVSSAKNAWGFTAEGAGNISAKKTDGPYTTDDNSNDAAVNGIIQQTDIIGNSETSPVPAVTLTARINNSGTNLWNSNLTTVLYSETGLKWSGDTIAGLNVNTNLVDKVYIQQSVASIAADTTYVVTNGSGSWTKEFFSTDTKFIHATDQSEGDAAGRMDVTASSELAGYANVVVGGKNQLFLQTWKAEELTLNQDIYIGTTTQDSAIRFGMDDYDVNLKGSIYLVDNAKMHIQGSVNHTVNISGKITDRVADLSGAVVNTGSTLTINGGKYNISGGIELKGLTIQGGAYVALSGASNTTNFTVQGGANVTLSGTSSTTNFTVQGGANVTLSGASSTTNNYNLKGGDLLVSSGNHTITGTLISETAGKGITIGTDAEHTAILNVNRMELGNVETGGDGYDYLTVNAGSILKITGSKNDDVGGNNFKLRSIVLGEWNQKTMLNVYGDMFAENATVFAGIKGGYINVEKGGTLAVNGISTARSGDNNSILNLTLKDGGELILGAAGISADTKNPTIILGAGTVGLYSDSTTIATAVKLQSTEGTKFNTQKYVWGTDATTGATTCTLGADAGSMTISGVISDAEGTQGKLVKTGAGTLTLSGTNTYSGGTVIEGGNLVMGNKNNQFLGTGPVTLAGGNLIWWGHGGTINTVSVTKNSDFTIHDQDDAETKKINLGSVTIAENVTLTVNKNTTTGNFAGNKPYGESWKHNLNIGVLTGAGALDVNGPGNSTWGEGITSSLTIDSLKGFTGNISVTSREAGSKNAYNATINTGADGASFKSLTAAGFGEEGEASTFTFNVQGATTVQNINVTSGKAIIDIAKEGTLNAFTKGGDGSITMKGCGIYNLGSSTTLNATLDSTWTGTVKMSGATLSDANLNAYGNAKSTVELSNVSGTLAAGTVATNISLVPGDNAPAFKSTASDGRTVTFAGAISGTGNFVVQADNTSAENYAADTYIFSGDVTGWKKVQGGYDIGFIAASAANVKYEGDATTINAGIYADGGALNATFGGEKAVTMNGDITNKKWQNTGTLNLTVSNSSAEGVTFTNTVKANTTTIAADSKATFTGATADLGTLTLAAGASVTTSGALTLGNISLDLTNYEAGNYTLVSATNGGSISWKKGSSWTHNGTLGSDLVANVGFVGGDNKTLTLTIAKAVDTVPTVVIEEKDGSFWYTLNDLGTSLTLNVKEGSLAGLVEGGLVELELISERMKQDILQKTGRTGDDVAVTLFLSDGTRTIEAGKDAIVGFYNDDHEGYWGKLVGSNRVYEIDRIPEPTTGALSLLGLAALAMRRRRK